MSEELNKPLLRGCPFCGGRAELVRTTIDYADYEGAITDSFMVRCTHCNARTENRESNVRMNNAGTIEVRKNGAEEVIQLWNRRTKFDLVEYPESQGE